MLMSWCAMWGAILVMMPMKVARHIQKVWTHCSLSQVTRPRTSAQQFGGGVRAPRHPWHPGWTCPCQLLGSHWSSLGLLVGMVFVGGHTWDIWLLAWGQEPASPGDQLSHHVQMAMHHVPQPSLRVVIGDKDDTPQLLVLYAWAWVLGSHGGVGVDWDTEAHAVHQRGHSLWGSSGSLKAGHRGSSAVRWQRVGGMVAPSQQ